MIQGVKHIIWGHTCKRDVFHFNLDFFLLSPSEVKGIEVNQINTTPMAAQKQIAQSPERAID